MPDYSDGIKAAVKSSHPNAGELKLRDCMTLPEGSIFYVEFDEGAKKNEFYYVLAAPSGIRLFDDAFDALDRLQTMIQGRKRFLQRIGEGSITDIVASLIALVVTLGFVAHTAATGKPDQSLLAVFTLVLGYYFGKKTS